MAAVQVGGRIGIIVIPKMKQMRHCANHFLDISLLFIKILKIDYEKFILHFYYCISVWSNKQC